MSGRRCIECKRALYPSEQGAMCSRCYFVAITDPLEGQPPPSGPPVPRWGSGRPAPAPPH